MLIPLRRMLLTVVLHPRKLLPLVLPGIFGFFFGAFLVSINQHLRSSTPLYWRQSTGKIVQHTANDRNLLLVGVMTAQRYLDTRALQIWRSWGRRMPGRVVFFVAEGTQLSQQVRLAKMPIVMLRGVDDAYPPQKKSFAMLRWMYDNQLANFHWFMRADDDLYVRGDKLKRFLLQLDPDKAHLLGQAGLGNTLEYGQLSLGAKDNYCMGGPGVILSRETLRQLAPHLQACLVQLLTTHEDVELGRCIRKHVGLACPWNYEMQTLFHNNASVAAFYSDSASPAIRDSPMPLRHLITLHPVKQPDAMRRIHLQAEILRLNEMRQRRMELKEELEQIGGQKRQRVGIVGPNPNEEDGERRRGKGTRADDVINGDGQEGAAALPNVDGARSSGLTPIQPNTTGDIPVWQFISADSKLLYCTQQSNCPRHTLEAEWRRALSMVIAELFDTFNQNSRQFGRTLHFQSLNYAYVRVQPRFGVDYVLDMALWYRRFRGPNRTPLAVRRYAYVQQRFGPLKSRLLSTQKINRAPTTVHIVVALKGRARTFERFARNLAQLSSEGNGRAAIELVLIHYSSDIGHSDEDVSINATLASLAHHLPVRLVQMPSNKEFNRGEALSAGAALVPAHSLLFFADVDVLIRRDALDRIRMNTVKGSQVYFPIVFSEFSPRTWHHSAGPEPNASTMDIDDHFVYTARRGYFRHFGYGIVSIYRADFDAVGGFNLTIQGWGLEDVDLFERIVKAPATMNLLRAPDPGLVHVFHPIDCSPKAGHQQQQQSKAQREACQGSRAQSLASLDFLAEQLGPYI